MFNPIQYEILTHDIWHVTKCLHVVSENLLKICKYFCVQLLSIQLLVSVISISYSYLVTPQILRTKGKFSSIFELFSPSPMSQFSLF